MCIIYRGSGNRREYIGGGSLIARNKILTVAHKFYLETKKSRKDYRDTPGDFYVECGGNDLNKQAKQYYSSQETQVKKIYVHPEYDPKLLRVFNFAILLTEE